MFQRGWKTKIHTEKKHNEFQIVKTKIINTRYFTAKL